MEYLTWIGETMATEYHNRFDHFRGRRKYLHAAMAAIAEYEKNLSALLIEGLQKIENLTIQGITNKKEVNERVPTISFTIEGINHLTYPKNLPQIISLFGMEIITLLK